MNVTVLHVDQCPHFPPLMQLLSDLLKDRADVALSTQTVGSDEEARRLDFHGSPTILIDGHDPFPSGPAPAGLSCRLYQTERGPQGLPLRSQLDEVLRRVD